MNKMKMNELIAEKIMGFKKIDFYGEPGWLTDNGINIHWSLFNPAEKLDHAWEVAKKLYIVLIPQCEAPREMSVHAEIDNQPFGNYYEAFAETPQLAICEVALKSIGLYKGEE